MGVVVVYWDIVTSVCFLVVVSELEERKGEPID